MDWRNVNMPENCSEFARIETFYYVTATKSGETTSFTIQVLEYRKGNLRFFADAEENGKKEPRRFGVDGSTAEEALEVCLWRIEDGINQ